MEEPTTVLTSQCLVVSGTIPIICSKECIQDFILLIDDAGYVATPYLRVHYVLFKSFMCRLVVITLIVLLVAYYGDTQDGCWCCAGDTVTLCNGEGTRMIVNSFPHLPPPNLVSNL